MKFENCWRNKGAHMNSRWETMCMATTLFVPAFLTQRKDIKYVGIMAVKGYMVIFNHGIGDLSRTQTARSNLLRRDSSLDFLHPCAAEYSHAVSSVPGNAPGVDALFE